VVKSEKGSQQNGLIKCVCVMVDLVVKMYV